MPKTPVQYKSSAVTDEDVQRLLDLAKKGAGAMESMTPRTETGTTTLYGAYRVHHENPFQKYSEMSLVSPHVFIPLAKLGLSMVSGFRLESEKEDVRTAMDEWSRTVTLQNKFQNIARCLMRDGTTVVYLPREEGENKAIRELSILPMRYTTLLPEGVSPGSRKDELLKGDVDRVILNESKASEHNPKHTEMNRNEVALFRIFHEGYFMQDIMGRETYGIYGVSALEPVERPIKNLLDLNEGYGSYMRRYGIGRLHLDIPLIEKLREEGRYQEAKDILEDVIAMQRKIGPNEDLVGGGMEVKSISTGSTPSTREMKESFQTDIHIGLLQSPISMGNTKGSTYASGYLSEEDRFFILESIQGILKETMQTEIIDPQLELLGFKPGDAVVTLDKLDMPVVDFRTLTDARMNGDITEAEYRSRLGFPEEMPKSEING